MPTIRINWKLVIVLLIGFVVLLTTAFGLHHWQRNLRLQKRLQLADKACNDHLWQQAAQNLGRYLSIIKNKRPLNHTDIPILLKYAGTCLNIRPPKPANIQQAIGAYRSILRIQKENGEAAAKLAQIYLQINMPGEAELILRRHLQTNQNPKSQRMLAMALAGQRKFKQAAEELKAIIQNHPHEILAYETLGQLVERQSDSFPESPDYWFDQAVTNNPSSAMAYIIRAAFHLRHKQTAKALDDLVQAEQNDLSNNIVRLRLAREFVNANALDLAEKHLNAAQALEPDSQFLWQSRALLALKSNSKEKMLKIAQAGLDQLSSQPWDFMPTAAELFIRSGQLDRAADCIDKLCKKDIAPAHTAFLQGLLAEQKADTRQACKHWQKAIDRPEASPNVHLALATALWNLGDRQSALSRLRSLLSDQPNFLPAHLTFGKFLAQTGNWTAAAEQARKARQLAPNNLDAALLQAQAQIQLLAKDPPDKHNLAWQNIEAQLTNLENNAGSTFPIKLLRFQLALHRRDFAQAGRLITDLKNNHHPSLQLAIAEADLLLAKNEIDQAVAVLHRTVQAHPDSALPVKKLAALLARQNNLAECQTLIKDAIGRIEKSAEKRDLALMLARSYKLAPGGLAGNEQKACRFLTELTHQMPDDILLKRQLLRYNTVIKDTAQAQQIIDDIRTIEGRQGWQWRYEQSKLWFASDRFSSRCSQITSLLKENLDVNLYDQPSRMLLAATHEKAGNLRLAIGTFSDALSYEPNNLSIITPLVRALHKAKQYNQADQILQKALMRIPSHPDLLKLQLAGYSHQSNSESVIALPESSSADDPGTAMQFAVLLHAADRFSEAAQFYRNILEREPNNVIAINNLAWIMCRHQGKPRQALELACKGLQIAPDYVDLIDTRGIAHYRLGNLKEAVDDFERSIKLSAEPTPATAASYFHLARALAELNRTDQAVKNLRHALDLNQKIGGLSASQLDEARQLLEKLLK